jgi:hypothetical protein
VENGGLSGGLVGGPCHHPGASVVTVSRSNYLYNFVRPHRALKFGREVRTPARQAGLTQRALRFREIFGEGIAFLASKIVLLALFDSVQRVSLPVRGVRLAA